MTTAAALLAAGAGTRFAGPTHKLLAPLRGRTVLEHAIANALAADLDETMLVMGALDLTEVARATDDLTLIWNTDWERGIASSLFVVICRARAVGHDAVVVGLGDQPFVEPEAWRQVAAAAATPIAVATYDGRRGNPVRLAAEAWPLLPTEGDEGARSLLRSRPELVTEVPCPGSAADIDTLEDLRSWS